MIAHDLVNGAAEVGITLWTDAGKLKYRSAGELENGLRTRLKKHRAEIINILSARQKSLMVLGYPCTCGNILYRQRAYKWRDFDNWLHDGYQCPLCGTRYKFVCGESL